MTRPKADRPHRVCAWVTDEEYQRVAAIRQALQLTTRDMYRNTVTTPTRTRTPAVRVFPVAARAA